MLNHIGSIVPVLCFLLLSSLAHAQDKFFDSNGVRIHYIEEGTGDPVVLVHGRNNTVQSWITPGILSSLAKDHRVIAIDCRGHGQSGKPHDPKQYGLEMSADIVPLMDHLSIRRAHVIGYSMGANITAQLLTVHPERFLTAVLGGSAGRFQWTAKDDEMMKHQAAETEKWGFSPSARLEAGEALTDEQISTRSAAILANPARDRFAMAAVIRSFREQAVTPEQVARVTVPTLGIAGTEDPNLADLQELRKLRPSLQLVVINGATHDGERGALNRVEFIDAVRRLLSTHP